ncbi:hypothetical protein TWF192_000764 [Orbilia oligospora]|uniref:RmlD-like substrate binding domain-containing protein n=1 Tax=Orbilia oligospora TaxID=2813651 RepID=A0A6G1LV03_ORBOL|nr:hypothetical protein TWF679_003255 [Orbilia oligospora]KAF3199757.1 hypothetical protein TWF191_004244 [Orbilia oligospora]KAF3235314.1 hypothetical protein TWF192_000764 [Orbilia oligospora]
MAKKKVLVTGATGLLGRQVVRAFDEAGWEVIGTGFSRANPPRILKLDITDQGDVEKVLDDVKPAIIIHCAAEKSPDRCASDPDGTKALNVAASQLLAEQTAARNIVLVYISTDYVFDGTPGGAPYETDAETSPPNFYGETKRDGEIAVINASDRAVVLRVPLLYDHSLPLSFLLVERSILCEGEVNIVGLVRFGSGDNSESAVNILIDTVWNKSGKEKVDMDHWAIRYPTNTEDVARVLKDIAEKYTSEDPTNLPRILQFSSEDRCTKYEICERLAQVLGLPMPHIIANSTVDPNPSVKRPYDCHLSTKALKDLGINVTTMDFEAWW